MKHICALFYILSCFISCALSCTCPISRCSSPADLMINHSISPVLSGGQIEKKNPVICRENGGWRVGKMGRETCLLLASTSLSIARALSVTAPRWNQS